MTRDFNKQRRDNERPYSRHSSSNRYGEERSPRPARPRLNRETVDRAWENGARQNHHDYHARNTNQSQPPRDNWRRNQQSGQPSAQNSRNNRKPYENRQGSHRYGERTPNGNSGARPRSPESGMRNFNEQYYDEHRGYSDRPGRSDTRPGYRESTQHSDSRSQFRGQGQNRGPRERDFDRDARPQRSSERDYRKPRDFDRETRGPRSFDRGNRSSRNGAQPDTRNPRWQSRPARQQGEFSRRPQEFTRYGSDHEQFEGDYERFDASNAAQHTASPSRKHTDTRRQSEERPVTQRPDVFARESTQDVPRKHTEFREEIAQEADELVAPVVKPPAIPTTEEDIERSPDLPAKGKPKSRARTASAAKPASKTKARQSKPKPRSTGPKPSQRGYKWPTP
jgi:hypothetical protein